jgi:hypothetical protein
MSDLTFFGTGRVLRPRVWVAQGYRYWPLRVDAHVHPQDEGYSWGNGSEGAHRLARDLLRAVLVREDVTPALVERFHRGVVLLLPNPFCTTSEIILGWCRRNRVAIPIIAQEATHDPS